jgi:hypothetical protein
MRDRRNNPYLRSCFGSLGVVSSVPHLPHLMSRISRRLPSGVDYLRIGDLPTTMAFWNRISRGRGTWHCGNEFRSRQRDRITEHSAR